MIKNIPFFFSTTLQSEIDVLNGLIGETEEKIKKESTVVKNKLNQEVADIMMALDDQDRHNADLHKAIKKQAKQISVTMSSHLNYELICFLICRSIRT